MISSGAPRIGMRSETAFIEIAPFVTYSATPYPTACCRRSQRNVSTKRVASLRLGLELRLSRDRESPPIAERLGGDLDSWRCLLPFVLAALHHPDHPPHQIWIEIMSASNLFGRARLLHVVFENRVERLVGRERIRILLVRAQFRGRWLLDRPFRNYFAPRVHVSAQAVHQRLRHI